MSNALSNPLNHCPFVDHFNTVCMVLRAARPAGYDYHKYDFDRDNAWLELCEKLYSDWKEYWSYSDWTDDLEDMPRYSREPEDTKEQYIHDCFCKEVGLYDSAFKERLIYHPDSF